MNAFSSADAGGWQGSRTQFEAACWGELAQRVLCQEQPGQAGRPAIVRGVTSQGVFLGLTPGSTGIPRWQVFLTTNPWRGPLTLNLPAALADPSGSPVAPVLQAIRPGHRAAITAQSIEFIEVQLSILTHKTVSWKAYPSSRPIQPRAGRITLLREIVQEQLFQNISHGLQWLIGNLLGLPVNPREQDSRLSIAFHQLSLAVARRDTDQILVTIAPFLGLGRGLTPSGDDLVCGFLLAYNRWGKKLLPGINAARVNHDICQMAWQKTSDLPASLIECASRAQADERLIAALDGLACGRLKAAEIIMHLASWGNTSGFDALVGMAIVLVM